MQYLWVALGWMGIITSHPGQKRQINIFVGDFWGSHSFTHFVMQSVLKGFVNFICIGAEFQEVNFPLRPIKVTKITLEWFWFPLLFMLNGLFQLGYVHFFIQSSLLILNGYRLCHLLSIMHWKPQAIEMIQNKDRGEVPSRQQKMKGTTVLTRHLLCHFLLACLTFTRKKSFLLSFVLLVVLVSFSLLEICCL